MSTLQTMLSRKAAKAYAAAGVAGLSFAVPVVDDGLLPSEALGIVLAALVAFQTTYWVSNRPASSEGGGEAGEP